MLQHWRSIACERALDHFETDVGLVINVACLIPSFILGWLRKPKYWAEGNTAPFWKAYTPEVGQNLEEMRARSACETALNEIVDIRDTANSDIRDIAHLAAIALGYIEWGSMTVPG